MSETTVTVQIPQPLYHRLEQTATRLQKPVKDFLADTLQAVLPPTEDIPADIQAELAALNDLDETALHNVAGSEMALDEQQSLDYLLDLLH